MEEQETLQVATTQITAGPVSVREVYLQTVQTEISFEVDYDVEALKQLSDYNKKLAACFELRLVRERQSADQLVAQWTEQLYDCARSKRGVQGPHPTAVAPVETNVARIEESQISVNNVLAELEHSRNDPLLCCRLSRSFRYEVACLYILGELTGHKSDLARGIRLLREIVFTFKEKPNCRSEYVQNTELRLGYLEWIYRETFSEAVDTEDERQWQGAESDARTVRHLKHITDDVGKIGSQLGDLSQCHDDCVSGALAALQQLSRTQSEVLRTVVKADDTCKAVSPALDQLDGAMKRLVSAIDGASRVASRG